MLGCTGSGGAPEAFYPTVEEWIGEGGAYTHPRAVYEGRPGRSAGCEAAGREAIGGFRFAPVTLEPGQRAEYVLLLGAEAIQPWMVSLSWVPVYTTQWAGYRWGR